MNRVMLKDGLISEDEGDNKLIANKCQLCGRVFFPQRELCLECYSDKLETIKLGNTGSLYTYTIVNMPAENYAPPYSIGWVELPEGVRVFGQIEGYENIKLHIGMDMQLVIGTLWKEQDKEIIAYKFTPLSKENSLKITEGKCGK